MASLTPTTFRLTDTAGDLFVNRAYGMKMASTGDLKVSFDLMDFCHREGRLFGFDTLKLGFAESASVLRGC